MKIVLKSNFLLFTFLLVVFNISAQINVINEGDVYVKPNTPVVVVANFENTGSFVNDGIVSFYYNFKNDGVVSFIEQGKGAGYTRFVGDKIQNISGIGSTEFKDILFYNPGSNLTDEGIIVSGDAEFRKGIVHNEMVNGGVFYFTETGTHSNASDTSFVQGRVDNIGGDEESNEKFIFPIGDRDQFYRPSIAAGPSLVNNLYKSEYFFENSNIAPHLHSKKDPMIDFIDNQEYWVKIGSVTTPDIALSLTWDLRTTSAEVLKKKEGTSLKIVRWDASKGIWVMENSLVDIANKTVTAAIKGYGIFTLARVFNDDVEDDVVVYNGISPDGDGINDYFNISGLDKFPNNTLEIFNRWGSKIFQTSGYGVNGNWFRGISEGKGTVSKGEKLPTGTYFYVLEYKTPGGKRKDKTGYLYIN